MPEFPQLTPPDAEVSVSFPYALLDYASHTSTSLEGLNPDGIPFLLDFHMERRDDKAWDVYTSMFVDFEDKMRLETFNAFAIAGGYEDVLYSKQVIEAVVSSTLSDFDRKMRDYAKHHDITHLPPELNYSDELGESVLDKLVAMAEHEGTLTSLVDDCMMVPKMQIPADHDGFIFRNTFYIVELLLHHPAFDRQNNRKQINYQKWVTHPAYMLMLKHKSLHHLGKGNVILNGADSTLLSLYVEMAVQCTVGQIWDTLGPLMREKGFRQEDESRFMEEGRQFYLEAKGLYTAGTVTNYDGMPIWDEVLG
jgi:hypothetical protein